MLAPLSQNITKSPKKEQDKLCYQTFKHPQNWRRWGVGTVGLKPDFSRTNVHRVKNGICHELLYLQLQMFWLEMAATFVMENSEHFRFSRPDERGTANPHQKFTPVFHGDFYARLQATFYTAAILTLECDGQSYVVDIWVPWTQVGGLLSCQWSLSQDGKNSRIIKLLGGMFLGHQGPRHRDIPDPSPETSRTKILCEVVCCFTQGMAGISRDLGRDILGTEKLNARKLWADFSFPTKGPKIKKFSRSPSGIESPSENEIFRRATHQGLVLL